MKKSIFIVLLLTISGFSALFSIRCTDKAGEDMEFNISDFCVDENNADIFLERNGREFDNKVDINESGSSYDEFYRVFEENDKICRIEFYKAGNLEQVELYRHVIEDDTDKGFIYFLDAEMNPMQIFYYIDGKLVKEEKYQQNTLIELVEYYPAGEKKSHRYFDNGTPVSCWEYYDNSGTLESKTCYNNGTIEKEYRYTFDNGLMTLQDIYESIPDKGVVLTETFLYFYDENGFKEKIEHFVVENSDGTLDRVEKYYSENGRSILYEVQERVDGEMVVVEDNNL